MGQHEVFTVHEFSVLSFQLQILDSSFLMQYQQDLPLGRMHPAKKEPTRSENRADFFAFFSAQLSSSEGLSATTEGDSIIDSATPISPCT